MSISSTPPPTDALKAEDILVGVRTKNLESLLALVFDHWTAHRRLSTAQRTKLDAMTSEGRWSFTELGHRVGLMRLQDESLPTRAFLVRNELRDPVLDDATPFLWVVTGPEAEFEPSDLELERFAWMLGDPRFSSDALGADKPSELADLYSRYLRFCHTPSLPPPAEPVPLELQRTGHLGGGLMADIRRRAPFYWSDFTDGLRAKSVASILFLYFACMAPSIAFGGLLSVLTDGQIGPIEMLISTALCGVLYALFSAQPLSILGSTGPVIVFMGILYQMCDAFSVPYLPTLCWVGLWTMLILILIVLTDASVLIRHFTRFTDETFAGLISMIFIFEALKDTISGLTDPSVPYDTALLSLILALGTYMVATQLSRLRRSAYLRGPIREFIADFGPTIAIVSMTLVALWFHPVSLKALNVPETLRTTADRSWFVNPLDAPTWVWFAAIVPGALMSVLLFLDQHITVRLVNDSRYSLKKGAGYHLDLLVIAVLVGICSMFGLPWTVAATVRSLNHVRSLGTTSVHSGEEQFTSVIETRVTGIGVHLLIAASLFFLGLLRAVPMSVLFGLFLFMGVASMRGNQLFERMRLWVMDPAMYPPTFYLGRVPRPMVHVFTAVQASCLAVLWIVKTSALGIVFPLFIALLVPVRMLLDRIIPTKYLAILDASEHPDEEEFRDLD